MLGKNYSRRQFDLFFLIFPSKIGFDISCKLSPQETICMKCQCLFSGKNKKNINLSSAGIAHTAEKVKISLPYHTVTNTTTNCGLIFFVMIFV